MNLTRFIRKNMGPFAPLRAFSVVSCLVLVLVTHFHQLAIASEASGSANLYLGINGKDTGNCNDPNKPCLTFNYADTRAVPGTVVHVGPGTYRLNSSQCIVTNTPGVTWQSDTRGAAAIDGGGNCQYIWHDDGPSGNVKIFGFQFTGVHEDPNGKSGGVLLEGCQGGFEVAYNTFHDLGTGIPNQRFSAALVIAPYGCGTNNYTGRTCSIHDNIFYRISAQRASSDKGGYSIYAVCDNHGGADPDPVIFNNLIYQEGSIGIHLWHAANHTHICNNTVDNAYIGILIGVGDQGAVNGAVFDVSNNIVSNSHYGIYAEDGPGSSISIDSQIDNNVVYKNAVDWAYNHGGAEANMPGFFHFAHNSSGDPMYVNPKAGNYTIPKNSTAARIGVRNQFEPVKDIAGMTRSNPPSAGAYEPSSNTVREP